MDKTYATIGIVLLLLAFALMFHQVKETQRYLEEQRQAEEQQTAPPAGEKQIPEPLPALAEPAAPEEAPAESQELPELIQAAEEDAFLAPEMEEEIYYLENDFIKVAFTNLGGAIKEVALKKYPAEQGSPRPYVFNAHHETPALAISLSETDGGVREYAPAYRLASREDNRIAFIRTLRAGLDVWRTYELSNAAEGPEPYVISHTTRFSNQTASTFNVDRIFVNAGTAAPTDADPRGFSLNAGIYDGHSAQFTGLSKFEEGGFMGLFHRPARPEGFRVPGPAYWVSVKNQFFAGILTPANPGSGAYFKPVDFPPGKDRQTIPKGITAALECEFPPVKAGEESALNLGYYAGPKEYPRLSKMVQRQDLIMQFGWFGLISKAMLHILIALERLAGNFGAAIILMTVCLRLALWPITAKAAQSSKKMARLQGPISEIREKYKDNPQKQQREMMKLWKAHKINPAAGCIPLLIQFPIFIGFYFMLRSASELRFAHFLWINDLSLPDTVARVAGFPFNPLPLVMAVSMFYQMRLMPAPTVDSTQQKIFQFMPFIFLLFCYNFSSGLVLYWTISNFFSIFQQLMTNRKKDPGEAGPSVSPAHPPAQAARSRTRGKKSKRK